MCLSMDHIVRKYVCFITTETMINTHNGVLCTGVTVLFYCNAR